jgi:hypothetical protein
MTSTSLNEMFSNIFQVITLYNQKKHGQRHLVDYSVGYMKFHKTHVSSNIEVLSFAQKEFDVVGPPVVMMLGRIQLFDYVGVFEEENSAMIIPALTEESTILSTIKPFQPIVKIFSFSSPHRSFFRYDFFSDILPKGVVNGAHLLDVSGHLFLSPHHQS